MNVPFLDLKSMHQGLVDEFSAGFKKFMDGGQYIMGPKLEEFERNFAAFCRTKYCAGVANGLDALILSLKAIGVGPGDDVVVPAHTFIATWLAVTAVGANVVPVEPRIETYNINPEKIRAALTPKTKAIIPVHLYGQCCEMDDIMAIAREAGIFVIEDNAQAQGATYDTGITGSFGVANATSFYPGKNLGALGDAGAVTGSDERVMAEIRRLRNYGSEKKYVHEVTGMNSRLDELQAYFLDTKLKKLNAWNVERNAVAEKYSKQLEDVRELILPATAPRASSVYHLYVVRTPKRDELQVHLAENGIGTLIHYPTPCFEQKAYAADKINPSEYPISRELAQTSLSLPMYPGLSDASIDFVAATIRKFFHA